MLKPKPLIGSIFYAGFLPNAPGTWGSFIALFPIYFIGLYTPWYGIILFTVISSLLTLWVSKACEQEWGRDPSPLVMDEFAGQGMAFIAIPLASPPFNIFIVLALGFLFFRFFDIAKPLGVDRLQALPGGWGILVDDLLAGLYAYFCLRIVILLYYII
ncbi:MAG TPA: phosphatidylglycerophosphatase A [Balneolaceae bacterium]|nr:phosphatidylglycerophosphatase A [Balneolaceae bacterium]